MEIYVLIPIFNNTQYIKECIDSINNNTIKCNIILGIDGCDKTKNYIETIMHQYSNLKVIYFNENTGTYITLNSMLQFVPDDSYIQIFGSDDIMSKYMLETMSKNTPCYSKYSGISLLHKSIYDKLGGYMPWRMAADTEFSQRLRRLVPNYTRLQQLFTYRQHKNNITKSKEYGLNSIKREEYRNYIINTQNDSTTYIEPVINSEYEILKSFNTSVKKQSTIVVGIATMNSRKNSLAKVLQSLNNQTIKPDKIVIYNNDENNFNATDNGKFYYFETEESKNEEVIFFSMDDDILYPKTYIEDMIKAIEKYNCIVTHHGRILNGLDLHYYRGHKAYSCLYDNNYEGYIDVAGTGVVGFSTAYFKPTNIFESEYKRMSDCIFSLEASKNQKDIIILKHKTGYLKDICDDMVNSCHRLESIQPTKQIEVCNEIYKLKKK